MSSDFSCTSCGLEAVPGQAFCGGCGTILGDPSELQTAVHEVGGEPGVERCVSCNRALPEEGLFCTSCGAPRRTTDSGIRLGPTVELKDRLEQATKGDYEILSHLGKGGMGSVFLALDLSLHRHVAIKVMAPSLVQDASMQDRFRTEARIVATLRHPGIVNIHGFRAVDDLYFFVMDYVDGAPLRSVIRAHGPLPIEVVKAVLYDVGSALQHAHSRGGGVVHRDVKPSNIILDSTGFAVVMDFGISKAANTQAGLTLTGMIVGTPEYMSPEQCRSGEITSASDQYSLGLVAYAMLTGAPPFAGQYWSVLGQQTTETPRPIRDLRPDCPEEMALAVERMLLKSARDRWPDMRTAVKALGGRRHEEGDPVRVAIEELVESVSNVGKRGMPVAGLSIRGIPERTQPGETLDITVTPVDGLGRALLDRAYTLESTNPGVLEVVSSGAVLAVSEGSAKLVARCEGAEVSKPLLVTPPPVAALTIMALPGAVRVGDEVTMRASTLDRSGAPLAGRAVVWTSSDPAVARISRNGVLKALGVGSTTIFATSEACSTTVELQVLEQGARAPSLAEAPPPVEVRKEVGATPPPSAPRPRSPDRPKPGSADRPKPRRRASRGLLLGLGTTAVIAGGAFAYQQFMTGSSPEEVAPIQPAAIAVVSLQITRDGAPTDADLELRTGDDVLLGAQPADGEGRPLDHVVEWTSSDPSIVEVDADGRVVAIAAGSVTITAIADEVRRTLSARVTAPTERVVVRQGGGGPLVGDRLALDLGESVSLQAGVADDTGAAIPERSIEWASSDAAIVGVGQDGTITGRAPGSARVTAASGDARQSIDVNVTVSVSELLIARAGDGQAVAGTVQLEVGGALALRATAFGPDDNRLAGVSASWTSSDTAVASVTQGGVVQANAEGAALIFVRVADVVQELAVGVSAPAPGTLVVTVRPWAYVSIDGVRQGEDQRRIEFSLPPGPHALRLENPAMITFDTTIVILSGETTSVDKLLVAGGGG